MACNAVKVFLDGEALHAVPYSGASAREAALLANTAALDQREARELTDAIIRQPEPAYLEVLSRLLLGGKGPRRILDTIQTAAAQVVIETENPTNFSLPQHCYEYCSTLGWFFDHFEHKQRLKLLYVAASFLNRAAFHQKHTGDLNPVAVAPPSGAGRMTAHQVLERVEGAVTSLDGPASLAWTQAYLDNHADRGPLIQRLAVAATRLGNDPHNQEIAQCMLDDWSRNQSRDRDRLLLAAAQHTAVHRKYGDALEASRRFGQAMDVPGLH
jgi:hypothetical protein